MPKNNRQKEPKMKTSEFSIENYLSHIPKEKKQISKTKYLITQEDKRFFLIFFLAIIPIIICYFNLKEFDRLHEYNVEQQIKIEKLTSEVTRLRIKNTQLLIENTAYIK